jgi:hypothetical protein
MPAGSVDNDYRMAPAWDRFSNRLEVHCHGLGIDQR